MSNSCLTPTQQLFSYIMAKINYIRGDDKDCRFVLNYQVGLDLYSDISLKQLSTDRHFSPLGHIYQPYIALTP